MRKDEVITHEGTIIEISDDLIKVEIISKSACAACHAKGLCGAGEEGVKQITLRTPDGSSYHLGESVTVALERSLGLKAVLLSYVIPVLILIILVVTLSAFFSSEWLVGLLSLGAVALYYLVLYFFRNKLSAKYEFRIVNC